MLDRVIPLKRNVVILQLLVFFPLAIFCAILGGVFQYLELDLLRRVCLFLGFAFQVILSYRIIQSNRRFVKFTEHDVFLYGYKNNKEVLLKQFSFDSIKSVVCDERKNTIMLVLHNMAQDYLLNFDYSKIIGEKVYFQIKAELCRYFPGKTQNIRDEYVEYYLENNDNFPQFIQTRHRSEICKAVVILFFEFIFAAIPIGLILLTVVWVFCHFCLIALKLLIFLLNLFAK